MATRPRAARMRRDHYLRVCEDQIPYNEASMLTLRTADRKYEGNTASHGECAGRVIQYQQEFGSFSVSNTPTPSAPATECIDFAPYPSPYISSHEKR
jgi:hypothetical protein